MIHVSKLFIYAFVVIFISVKNCFVIKKKTSEHSGRNRTLPKYANRFIWGQIDYEFKKVFKDV